MLPTPFLTVYAFHFINKISLTKFFLLFFHFLFISLVVNYVFVLVFNEFNTKHLSEYLFLFFVFFRGGSGPELPTGGPRHTLARRRRAILLGTQKTKLWEKPTLRPAGSKGGGG